MSGLLDQMRVQSQARVSAARDKRGLSEVRQAALERSPPPKLVLSEDGFDLIAEIKLASPSAGALALGDDKTRIVSDQALAYTKAGAAAVSVLTEPHRFDGRLEHVETARAATDVPLMRKDFLVDPYQVWEARLSGASGILLIVRMLGDDRLVEMLEASRDAGLFVLVECFDDEELQRAGRCLDRVADVFGLIGLNARNLQTLEIEPARFETWAGLFPKGYPKVAESSLETPRDAAAMARLGYDLALVGTSLMRSHEPDHLAREMIAAGREAKRSSCAFE